MKRILALAMVLLLVLACFAGCGEQKDDKKADETTVAETTPTTVAPKTVIAVGYTIYDPMNYKDESGKLVGFDTELAEKVFTNLGYEVKFQEIEWSQKYTDLNSGTIDCVWNGFTCNTADDDGVLRADKVDFSFNYMENRQVVVVKKDANVQKAEDLNGKKGTAEKGSAGEGYAKGFEGTTFKDCIKQTECLTEINSGTADFAVVDEQLAKSYVGKGDYADLMIVDALTSDVEYYAIGFKKGSPLTAKVNAQLEALAKDGTLTALATKYGKEAPLPVITNFDDQK